MTEEEKKAIEYLTKWVHWETAGERNLEGDIETALNLINKQQKEIKELNLENQAFYEEMNCNDNEYISKKYLQLKEKNKKIQKEIEALANVIRVLGTNPDITTEEIIKEFTEKPISEEYMKKFNSSYISKDKILKALGYDENDEEYKRLYNKEDLILSLIRTINEECDRLEDIEDQKVMLEEHNIENMRDKYWEKKIKDKIKEVNKRSAKGNITISALYYIENILNELLEE